MEECRGAEESAGGGDHRGSGAGGVGLGAGAGCGCSGDSKLAWCGGVLFREGGGREARTPAASAARISAFGSAGSWATDERKSLKVYTALFLAALPLSGRLEHLKQRERLEHLTPSQLLSPTLSRTQRTKNVSRRYK